MRLKSFVYGTTSAVLLGSLGLPGMLVSSASAAPDPASLSSMAVANGMRDGGMHVRVWIGPTGNTVEMVDPGQSTYVPRIAAATDRERAKAQRLLDGVNSFCSTHSASKLKANWRRGTSPTSSPTHFFNPDPKSGGLNPANPRAALIYDGKLGGVMFTGKPLPSLGSIPRAHAHSYDPSMPMEMVHVYCTTNLKQAFTPNRMLGVKADMITLRLKIRPAVMDLTRHQLRDVRAKVRGYAGDKLTAVTPVPSATGPDPVLRAMRTEIRKSLMILSEHQLRSVWQLMQSY